MPKWLNETKISACTCCEMSASSKGSYLDKTIAGIRGFLVETFLQESSAEKNGLLQKLDPRLKLIAALTTILALSFVQQPAPSIIVFATIALIAYFSHLDIWSFGRRLLLTTGLFTALIMLPAILNISVPGRSIVVIYQLRGLRLGGLNLPATLAITDNGLRFFLLFWLRAMAMTSVSIIAIVTTRREHLLAALQALRLPSFLTMMAALAYRFLHTLLKVIENVHLAKKSRSIRLGAGRDERRWVAGRIGWTFEKATAVSSDVTEAMISRGGNAENSKANIFKFKLNDYIALILLIPFFTILFAIILLGY